MRLSPNQKVYILQDYYFTLVENSELHNFLHIFIKYYTDELLSDVTYLHDTELDHKPNDSLNLDLSDILHIFIDHFTEEISKCSKKNMLKIRTEGVDTLVDLALVLPNNIASPPDFEHDNSIQVGAYGFSIPINSHNICELFKFCRKHGTPAHISQLDSLTREYISYIEKSLVLIDKIDERYREEEIRLHEQMLMALEDRREYVELLVVPRLRRSTCSDDQPRFGYRRFGQTCRDQVQNLHKLLH